MLKRSDYPLGLLAGITTEAGVAPVAVVAAVEAATVDQIIIVAATAVVMAATEAIIQVVDTMAVEAEVAAIVAMAVADEAVVAAGTRVFSVRALRN